MSSLSDLDLQLCPRVTDQQSLIAAIRDLMIGYAAMSGAGIHIAWKTGGESGEMEVTVK